ncbi:MAG TPA: nucleotide exchange factor GrpE [Candidatus Omnitrophica bacterium]|nr:MAG: nucleotide exchange factor GrpE [Candidatus Korarchaeota archaeon]HDL10000.1 nucleotide exchange factor GrpE [Candidatus Omnitrophota bacterium]
MKKKEERQNNNQLQQNAQVKEQEKKKEVILSQEEYEKMVAEIQDLKEKWLRAAAELENAKKRWQKEKEEILTYGNSQIISALLPVLDHFGHAIQELSEEKNEFEQGVELIYKELITILSKFGLEKIADLEGKDFDPFEHEAISYEENDEMPEGKVIEVMRPGYRFQNRLLRPALVKVSKGKKEEAKQDTQLDNQQGGEKDGESNRN